jgi:protein-disulfide isomerase
MVSFPLFYFSTVKSKTSTFQYIIVVLGGIISFALQQRGFHVSNNNFEVFDACASLLGKSCDGTLLSSFSSELGISLPSLGLLFFGFIGLSLIIDKPVINRLALLVSAFASGSVLLLSFLLILTDLSCALCLFIHVCILFSFILLGIKLALGKNESNKNPTIGKRIFAIAATVLLFLSGLFVQVLIVGSSEGLKALQSMDASYQEYGNAPDVEFDWSHEARVLGAGNTRINLVIISSFQCPGCQTMSASINRLKGLYGDDLSINYINYPLSSQCNQQQQYDMQPQSCSAALAALAAGNQDKFWEYHDKIFDSDLDLSEEELLRFALDLDLNIDKWNADRYSDNANSELQEDISLGNALMVNATPTIYLNGKKSPRIDEAFLRYIIESEPKKNH